MTATLSNRWWGLSVNACLRQRKASLLHVGVVDQVVDTQHFDGVHGNPACWPDTRTEADQTERTQASIIMMAHLDHTLMS